jgi:mannose-6-phosphate isomerase-like protein (cupin superfamily)
MPKRIITGHNAAGRSVIKINDTGAHGLGSLSELWVTETVPADNTGDVDTTDRPVTLGPPDGGIRFRYFKVGPESAAAGIDPDERRRLVADRFAEMDAADALVDVSRHPAMHKTRTVDYIILLSGNVTLLLDDDEVDLEPFDVVVQRGTNHAWVNHGDEEALLIAVLVDAEAE